MFIVFLNFSENRAQAPEFMQQHIDWIKASIADGVFLVVGSLGEGAGGGIVAHNIDRDALEQLINTDPFVAHNIVTAKITELTPAQTDPRLSFLLSA